MKFGIVEIYLLAINVLGFAVGAINSKIRSNKEEGRSDIVLAILSIFGGAVGALISVLVFDRKAEKGNMLSRVIMSCLVVIDIIVYLIYKGFVARNLTFAFWNILMKYPISLIYLALINIVTFFVYLKDKKAAEKGKDRVKIVTLLSLSFIGGSIGALCGMYILHHKTNKSYFTVGVPLMIVVQILVLFYLSNMAF
mgnify:FL=1